MEQKFHYLGGCLLRILPCHQTQLHVEPLLHALVVKTVYADDLEVKSPFRLHEHAIDKRVLNVRTVHFDLHKPSIHIARNLKHFEYSDFFLFTFPHDYQLWRRICKVCTINYVYRSVYFRHHNIARMTLPIEIELWDVGFLLVTTSLDSVENLARYFITKLLLFSIVVFCEALHSEIDKSCRFVWLSC